MANHSIDHALFDLVGSNFDLLNDRKHTIGLSVDLSKVFGIFTPRYCNPKSRNEGNHIPCGFSKNASSKQRVKSRFLSYF